MPELSNENHTISILQRESIDINGVKKIVSFDDEEFLLDTTFGPLEIKGSDLEIRKLDTYQGTISIKGILNSFTYLNLEGKKEAGMLSKLFK